MSRIKTHVKPDDLVEVIAGNHKGKQGKVLEVHPEREQVIVEGVRVMKLRKDSNGVRTLSADVGLYCAACDGHRILHESA